LKYLFYIDPNTNSCIFLEKIKGYFDQYLKNDQLKQAILMSISCENTLFNPPIIKPKRMTIDDVVFAKQITMKEWKYFLDIENKEFFEKIKDPNNKDVCKNLNLLINWTNTFSLWLSVQILSEVNVSKRANLLSKMLTLADNFLRINNFNGAMEVYSAINHRAFYRLKLTWEKISKKAYDIFENLKKVFAPEKNYVFFRQTLHDASYPKMPFIGLFMTDLTFIQDGFKKDYVESNDKKLINVEKWVKFGKVLNELLACQYDHYNFKTFSSLLDKSQPNDALAFLVSGLSSAPFFGEDNSLIYTDDTLMDKSLQIEPRK